MPPNGIERFVTHGDIFYQTTPYWLWATETFAPYVMDYLGPERYMHQYPLKSVKNGGVLLTFGSESNGGDLGLNVFYNCYFAVNRGFDNGTNILPPNSEALTIEECIDAYTINGAKQAGAANDTGSIAVGKSADFVVLNQDVLTIPSAEILNVTVNQTYFRGKMV